MPGIILDRDLRHAQVGQVTVWLSAEWGAGKPPPHGRLGISCILDPVSGFLDRRGLRRPGRDPNDVRQHDDRTRYHSDEHNDLDLTHRDPGWCRLFLGADRGRNRRGLAGRINQLDDRSLQFGDWHYLLVDRAVFSQRHPGILRPGAQRGVVWLYQEDLEASWLGIASTRNRGEAKKTHIMNWQPGKLANR